MSAVRECSRPRSTNNRSPIRQRTTPAWSIVDPSRCSPAKADNSARRSEPRALRSRVSKFFTPYFLISTSQRERLSAFTLLELLVVIAIIAILMVLIAPAFTTIKSGNDVTSAAYTIKGVLDQARTYAKANNTYTWVGFYEENTANPASPNSTTPAVGRVIMSIVASKDGTNVATSGTIDPTTLVQVGKLTKIDNVHLVTFPDATATPPPITFNTRPPVTFSGTQYSLASMPSSATPFQYPVGNPTPAANYTFLKAVQFSPGGEARIENNTNSPQTVAEIGLEPTHGAAIPNPTPANLVAIQFTGEGGNVKVYRQ